MQQIKIFFCKALSIGGLIAAVLVLVGLIMMAGETRAQEDSGSRLLFSPSEGTFLVGSTFDVSIILDTNGATINTVKAEIKFPQDRLQVVSPSGGKSFVSTWLEQPSYSNTEGAISFTGGIPDGIKTSSGVVSTITFRVVKSGEAVLSFLPSSSVLAHDGKGTNILSKSIDGRYQLKARMPEGPKVFSPTHPDEGKWYNNNNPIISWEKETGVTDFSYILDNFPQTVPDNTAEMQDTTKSFESLDDGLWYFHIKAKKDNIWGSPSHFVLRLDTTPPADFKLQVQFLMAAIIGRAMVSFNTTDALSGVDHYEVAVIDRTEPPLKAPVFIEAQSPYQLPQMSSGHLRVLVRAVDRAGNARDAQIDTDFPDAFFVWIKSHFWTLGFSSLGLVIGLAVVFGLLKRQRRKEKPFVVKPDDTPDPLKKLS